jgi:starch synthase
MLKISLLSSEVAPFAKTGGLADVAGTLPLFLVKKGVSVRVFLPLYGFINTKKFGIKKIAELKLNIKDLFIDYFVWMTSRGKANFYFIEQKKFFGRSGIYGDSSGEYRDSALRFIFFQKAVVDFLKKKKMKTDVFHINDWQTSLLPRFLKGAGLKGKTLLTIHNLAYQGVFDIKYIQYASMKEKDLLFGKINFLYDGILNSDFITTVSPTYAKQILTKEFGCGLEKFLRRKNIKGILNGIDYSQWNPATDRAIAKNYSISNPAGKEKCKLSLLKELSLRDGRSPVFGFVGRAAGQKGFDIIASSLPEILKKNIRIIFLCDGERRYKKILMEQKKIHPRKISVNFKFDEELAHKIYAARDFFLMPSRFEPCGLAQMIAMRYGTVPIVNPVGGLKDTVAEFKIRAGRGTGFLLKKYSASGLVSAVQRAMKLFENGKKMEMLRIKIMKLRFSWERAAGDYIKIYKNLARKN